MKIMIMSCEDKDSWYAPKIGKIYEVTEINPQGYKVKMNGKGDSFGIVKTDDCQVLGR